MPGPHAGHWKLSRSLIGWYLLKETPRNLQALKRVLADHPHNNAQLLAGDANTEVQQLCQSINWGKTRGVIFLDPFGNSVEWATIEALAK